MCSSDLTKRSVISKLTGLAVVVAAITGGYLYGRTALDIYSAANFTPPADVAAVEESIKLTPGAQRTFRATRPAIESSSDSQWTDDVHHALHARITGESQGYYADFAAPHALSHVYEHAFLHDGGWSSFAVDRKSVV